MAKGEESGGGEWGLIPTPHTQREGFSTGASGSWWKPFLMQRHVYSSEDGRFTVGLRAASGGRDTEKLASLQVFGPNISSLLLEFNRPDSWFLKAITNDNSLPKLWTDQANHSIKVMPGMSSILPPISNPNSTELDCMKLDIGNIVADFQ
ncbi:hypothetical protein TorRG33x02_264070 [Trema orientale]|uniref:Uncharacterized protein n=1 Tax=Trema orientale TaxID=63057 RepID=A0A2P5D2W9_TREOI|nr:hypothetical protein TorRG33x02_264070 [Trema orientale]